MHPFRTFRRFADLAEAEQFTRFLQSNGIPVELENVPPLLDAVIIGQQFAEISVKVPDDYFTRVNTLLRENTEVDVDAVEPGYYLLAFTDEELLDIVRHPDEWGDYDNALAIALLHKRGIPISDDFVESAQEKRIGVLAKPITVRTEVLVGLYLLAFFNCIAWITPVFSLSLLVAGMITGILFSLAHKTLPDGQSVPMFDNRARRHGIRIFFVGLVMVPVWFVVFMQLSRHLSIHQWRL